MQQTVTVPGGTFGFRCKGQGIPLLLVHGFPLDGNMWRGQLEPLAAHCQVIVPDLLGFGASSTTDRESSTMVAFAEELAALLQALQVDQPMVFCGLSMGGYIGWEFWRHFREKLAGLILCDTRAIADDDATAKARHLAAGNVLDGGVSSLVEGLLPKLFAESTFAEQPGVVGETKQQILRTSPEAIAAALRGMAHRADVTSQLAEIQIPSLAICGSHDVISPPAEMQQIAAAMPQCRYVEIAQAGHMSPLEQPQAFNAAVLDFLQGLA